MLLGQKATSSLLKIESISPRIMIATFNGNTKLTLISCYSPTNVSEEKDTLTLYTEVMSVVQYVPKHSVLVIGGDMQNKYMNEINKCKIWQKCSKSRQLLQKKMVNYEPTNNQMV